MADITVATGGSTVLASAGAKVKWVTCGVQTTAGEPVYLDSADSNKSKLCDSDFLASSDCEGIALNGAEDGQPLKIITKGELFIGGTVAVGTRYFVSVTAGGITPHSDAAALPAIGDYVTLLAVGKTTTLLDVQIHVSGVAIPA